MRKCNLDWLAIAELAAVRDNIVFGIFHNRITSVQYFIRVEQTQAIGGCAKLAPVKMQLLFNTSLQSESHLMQMIVKRLNFLRG